MQLDLNRRWAKLQFAEPVRLRLYRKVAKMLSNGLPLLKILEELRDRATKNGQTPNGPLAIVLDDCRRLVQNGSMFGEALGYWVPDSERMIVTAGEQAGQLEATLLSVVDVVVAGKKIKAVIISGLTYPVAILVIILCYLYVFGTRVIPEFAKVSDPSTWHGVAKSLHVMSQLVQHWMLPFVLSLTLLFTLVLWSMPRWCGSLRVHIDRLVPYSIYRLVTGSGFLMAFSALQHAGVTVEKSLVRLSDMAQPWLRERLDGALLGVKSGMNCGEAFRNAGYQFPSEEIIDDLCVYAEYKGFSQALKTLADEWMEEGVETVSVKMKVLNGVAIALLAVIISWLVAGFFGIQQELTNMTRAVH
ncbi:type II secretion system F family protein [Actimicrobium sp. CCI2.3]|uniref:type II secretion system F family protein n=1 Tax=Actimicrobium sp. CCI2.3 TaxID=3048616 RepID=UPI002AB4CC8A|nr:type II secretion system F family protein [Actimicrobium sp. CCI2.3]MDY7573515.1 type II secretion system F family protein [Actimicrobium sp. CCI2.3]MEB0022696.1 type II secretion system F family protein [Actimicrobium sp. CCI2.3]